MTRVSLTMTILAMAATLAACKKPPAATPAPNPFPGSAPVVRSTPAPVTATVPPPPPVIPVDQPVIAATDPMSASSIENINKDSPLKPVFFAYDSDALDERARAAMDGNAQVLRQYQTWLVTVEGHCDERGTAEYNLALGDRRALAVKTYLVSLGIATERIRTVSYGSEFPFSPGHDEGAWALNRRAHFMLTAKQE